MSGRDTTLSEIRKRLGGGAAAAETARQDVRRDIRAPRRWPQPTMDWELMANFRERCLGLSCTFEELDDEALLPETVGRYVSALNEAPILNGWAEFAHHDWVATGVTFIAEPVTGKSRIGLTGAFCAIAETGALMQLSSPATPAATSLLPESHIAIVNAANLVRTLEDAWSLLRSHPSPIPRAVNLVAGPSRTGDIEQTTTIGVHGPRRVHVIVINNQLQPTDKQPLSGSA